MTRKPAPSKARSSVSGLLGQLRDLIRQARLQALRAVDLVQVRTSWEVGRHIVEFEQGGRTRASYGSGLLAHLGERLTAEFGAGFDVTNLYKMTQFYRLFPNLDSVRLNLSWTHYRHLLRLDDPGAREWYANEAAAQNWSTRQLERQIGMPDTGRLLESKLEDALIGNLQAFLLELGKGFAFVARQQRISTESKDFYIDLVFYNYVLKCFVLFDLKTRELTHENIGQMDMYVRLYDDQRRGPGDNPTVGIILCANKDETIVRYSVLHGNEKLFASKYKLILPSEAEFRKELARELDGFRLQQMQREAAAPRKTPAAKPRAPRKRAP